MPNPLESTNHAPLTVMPTHVGDLAPAVIGDMTPPTIEVDPAATTPAGPVVDVDSALAMFRLTGETITTAAQDVEDIDMVKKANPGIHLYLCFVDGRLYLFRPMNEEEYESIVQGGSEAMKVVVAACMLLPSPLEFATDLKHHVALKRVFGMNLIRITGDGDPQYALKEVA